MINYAFLSPICNPELMNKVLVMAAAPVTLNADKMTNTIMEAVNFVLRILCGILVGVTGIKLIMSSLAMSTAVGEERQQKKDDLVKAVKNFGITVAVTATVLVGGKEVMKWVEQFIGKEVA